MNLKTNWNNNEIIILGNTPLHVASEIGNEELVNVLLGKGGHLDAINNDKLVYSILFNILKFKLWHY